MKQLTKNVMVETGQRGSNHGLVTTSDGLVLIDGPHKPSDALRLKADIERRGQPLRYILNTEPHGDHWTSNAYFDAPVVAHQGVRQRILETNMPEMLSRVATFGPGEGKLLEGYRANAPVITFDKEMTLHVGDHTFRLVSMPGHTPYQAAIIVQEEGVVFTSDNIFCKCHTWLQEADPVRWLDALESLRGLREDSFVPGHGPVCDKRYLAEQGAFIQEWVDYVRAAAGKGMSRDDAVKNLTAMTDRYPMDVEQDGMAPRVMQMNAANLYDYVTATGIHRAGAWGA
jgi:glyoxylase-like metal-dependent hydrolase (beta-lactamase superfamily II)